MVQVASKLLVPAYIQYFPAVPRTILHPRPQQVKFAWRSRKHGSRREEDTDAFVHRYLIKPGRPEKKVVGYRKRWVSSTRAADHDSSPVTGQTHWRSCNPRPVWPSRKSFEQVPIRRLCRMPRATSRRYSVGIANYVDLKNYRHAAGRVMVRARTPSRGPSPSRALPFSALSSSICPSPGANDLPFFTPTRKWTIDAPARSRYTIYGPPLGAVDRGGCAEAFTLHNARNR